jgi:hypothetical protein
VGSAGVVSGEGETNAAVGASGEFDATGALGDPEGTADADADGPVAALQATASSNGARQTNVRPEPRHRDIAAPVVIVKSLYAEHS